ncbi:MAG: hypothetical protein JJU46_09200 [Balneolaceae bacterium]|nr:hypothetical protein [Balneolaceae bacterium]MCH8547451.1 hypothetical protein [Balneolaceae bacterium]
MSQGRKGNLFIIAFVILVLQYALVGIVGELKSEPWPAFVFPGFKSVYSDGEGYQLNDIRFELYEGEEVVTLMPHHLFSEMPRSQVSGFVRSHFSDPDQIDSITPEAREWLYKEARRESGLAVDRIELVGLRFHFPQSLQVAEPDSVTERFRIKLNKGER